MFGVAEVIAAGTEAGAAEINSQPGIGGQFMISGEIFLSNIDQEISGAGDHKIVHAVDIGCSRSDLGIGPIKNAIGVGVAVERDGDAWRAGIAGSELTIDVVVGEDAAGDGVHLAHARQAIVVALGKDGAGRCHRRCIAGDFHHFASSHIVGDAEQPAIDSEAQAIDFRGGK